MSRPRSVLGVVALVVVVLALVMLGTACSGGDADPSANTTDAPPAVEPTGSPGTPEHVISGAEQLSLLNEIDRAATLSYLVRKFGSVTDLDWASSMVDTTRRRVEQQRDDRQVQMFARLVDPDAPAPEAAPYGNTTDALVARALWCDQLEVPREDVVAQLDQFAARGGYDLTHAFGAAVLRVELGCDTGDDVLVDRYAPQVAELLNSEDVADLQLEACALLAWGGRTDLVPADVAERVDAAQLNDGGWPTQPGDRSSQWHPTLWGLRCQLELSAGAGVEPVPWVQRRS